MTEEEAKLKWCPFVRLQANYDGEEGSNRTFKGIALKEANCIASDCACWVDTTYLKDKETGVTYAWDSWRACATEKFVIINAGHCGLIRG